MAPVMAPVMAVLHLLLLLLLFLNVISTHNYDLCGCEHGLMGLCHVGILMIRGAGVGNQRSTLQLVSHGILLG